RLDIRIVAATNRDLRQEIARGRLRDDLYFRLAGVEIAVPPLRERREDIVPLAEHYLRAAARQSGRGPTAISTEAAAALQEYRWPGNVRELRNLMERSALLVRSPVLLPAHLPADVTSDRRGGPSNGASAGGVGEQGLKGIERLEIQKVLEEEGWH